MARKIAYAGYDPTATGPVPVESADPLAVVKREVEQLRAENKALRSVVATIDRLAQPYANNKADQRPTSRGVMTTKWR